MDTILIILFILSTLVQMFFYLWVFRRLAVYQQKPEVSPYSRDPVSVIICARNEAYNLQHYLPAVLEQQYHPFEVVVVDDGSSDDTAFILENFKKKHTHLKVISLNDTGHRNLKGKKHALNEGIKAARYAKLVLTDADCKPASGQWLKIMADGLNGEKQIVLGYSPYEPGKGLFSMLMQFEGFYVALQYLSFALWHKPYMGVGRNLAYDKALYHPKHTLPHAHLASGDDDLTIHAMATADNTAIQIHPATFVYTQPPGSFREWLKQKTRHSSTSLYYSPFVKYSLFTFHASTFLFYLFFFVLLFQFSPALLIFILLFLVLSAKGWVFWRSMRLLNASRLFPISLLLDIGLSLFYLILGARLIFTKETEWKKTKTIHRVQLRTRAT